MLRLKDIKEKYEVYRWNEYYLLHRRDCRPGDTSVYPYLCKFIFKKDKAILDNGIVCRNFNQFEIEVSNFIKTLSYNPDNYNPRFRIGYFEEKCFLDAFKAFRSGDGYTEEYQIAISNGFNNIKLSSYPSYDPEKGSVYINLPGSAFRLYHADDLESAIRFVNEHIYTSALMTLLSSYSILEDIGDLDIQNDIIIEKLILNGRVDIRSTDFKSHLIELATKFIGNLTTNSTNENKFKLTDELSSKYPIFKERIENYTNLIIQYATKQSTIPDYFVKEINTSWDIIKMLNNDVMHIDNFSSFSDRQKWDISKYLNVEWKCPSCDLTFSDEPIRCEPFPGTSLECDECGYELTHRTGGGQSDPFKWIF